jgi:DcaP outer membrane protein
MIEKLVRPIARFSPAAGAFRAPRRFEVAMKWCMPLLVLTMLASPAAAEDTQFDVYGFVMMDAGYSFNQTDPDWFDVIRTTKLPAFEDQFAPDGNTYFSVRQTRFGVKSTTPTDMGALKTQFEWELFGTGVDAGQTTIRLRHAYGELGHVGAGQYWSPFMDIDVFPNTVEYWGPPGMAFFRNVQLRWMPIQGDSRMTIALERPGASSDLGDYADRIELQGVDPHFPVPDLSGEYRHAGGWGYVEIAGIVRYMEWEDNNGDALDLSGDATGWGFNLSSNVKLGDNNIFRLSGLYGEGIENYMNDAPADIGVEPNPGNALTPITGEPIPVTGVVAFLDHTWSERYSTSVGYSMIDIDNTSGQAASAFHRGHYAIGNLAYYPVSNVMTVAEFQYGKRENNSDGFTSEDMRVQFSFKYNFALSI